MRMSEFTKAVFASKELFGAEEMKKCLDEGLEPTYHFRTFDMTKVI